ncbi:MAG TPA: tRNA pseudouridine(55) synthase TruB [Pirellulales bacterium]|nr:tRNA pseudouridine(55) synthase TruB [Pirellulales bacterium]
MSLSTSGLINVNKPRGLSSRAVVDRVAKLVRPAKAGHAGTLDPLATGVLVVAVGAATRLIGHVQRMPKRYRGTFLLGRSSPTEDIEGDVELLLDAPEPSRAELDVAAAKLVGSQMQRPPAFSALKLQGRPAYQLARRGQAVELAPRLIMVYQLSVARYDYPELVLDIECGGGTYVRSLGRDLAESLGTAAVMSALERTAIGSFTIEQACPFEELDGQRLAEVLLQPVAAVADLPSVVVTSEEIVQISHARFVHRTDLLPADEYTAMDEAGNLVALMTPRGDGYLGAHVNFIGK